jgi:hypothetical protein
MRPKWSIGYEWEEDRCPCCGLELGVVNATSHLWQVSQEPAAGSTQVIPFRHARPPLLASAMPDPGLGAAGFDWGRFFQGWRTCLFRLTNKL